MFKSIAQIAIIATACVAQKAIGEKIISAHPKGKLTHKQAIVGIYAGAIVSGVAMVASIVAVGNIGNPSSAIDTTASDIPDFTASNI